MIKTNVQPNLVAREFENFELSTLVLDSEFLRGNPQGDSVRRHIPVMTPKGPRPTSGWPVVLMLSGFTGNGPQTFNVKTFETGAPDILDGARGRGEAPASLYVFCDAMTFWGGSQFVDSRGLGKYASYILEELCPALIENYSATVDQKFWCVMGGSSGGYGALQLSTAKSRADSAPRFGVAIAIAPDSFFDASLLPDLRTALPIIKKMGGVKKVREELSSGKLTRRKEWHTILNAVGMGYAYAPLENGEPLWPLDLETGTILEDVWTEWKKHDPLIFLQAREKETTRVRFYLDAGDRDQFQLQYGTRQIRELLKAQGCDLNYVGFDGTHFDLSERRLPAWTWLGQIWRV